MPEDSVLDPEKRIHRIRTLQRDGYTPSEIANIVIASVNTVRDVLNGKTWRHVPWQGLDELLPPGTSIPGGPGGHLLRCKLNEALGDKARKSRLAGETGHKPEGDSTDSTGYPGWMSED